MRVIILFCLSSLMAFAENWSGALVDFKCYLPAVRNVDPNNTSLGSRDLSWNVQYCHPTAKTTSFGVVLQDWSVLELDAAGNAKAAKLVPKAGKDSSPWVNVTGEKQGKTVKVESISLSK